MAMSTTDQPSATLQPRIGRLDIVKGHLSRYGKKVSTRDGWLGDYDYGWCVPFSVWHVSTLTVYRLCMPTLPYSKNLRMPPFYALDADLPLLLAISSGFQHALAMLAGLITPPIIFASALSLDAETSAYMISASLIGCGKSARYRTIPS